MKDYLRRLEQWGASCQEALYRLDGDEPLYRGLVFELAASDEVQQLGRWLDQKEYEKALRLSHSLKGAAGNLSLSPLAHSLQYMVECLRPDEQTGRRADEETIRGAYRKVRYSWTEYQRIIEEPGQPEPGNMMSECKTAFWEE